MELAFAVATVGLMVYKIWPKVSKARERHWYCSLTASLGPSLQGMRFRALWADVRANMGDFPGGFPVNWCDRDATNEMRKTDSLR